MAQRIIASMGTGVIADGSQEAFSIHSKHFRRNIQPVVTIKGLVSAETASLWKHVAGDWEEVADSSGTQIDFTATTATYNFSGPGEYGFTKVTSVSALVVTLDDGI
jgi:hypothetical protein